MRGRHPYACQISVRGTEGAEQGWGGKVCAVVHLVTDEDRSSVDVDFAEPSRQMQVRVRVHVALGDDPPQRCARRRRTEHEHDADASERAREADYAQWRRAEDAREAEREELRGAAARLA
eukprot:gene19637-35427_t